MKKNVSSNLNQGPLDLGLITRLQRRPPPFTPGEPLFWDDPHISAQMLAAHLDPAHDRASRRPAAIDRSVDWLVETLGLTPGAAVLDLGCGPGLYATRLARRGLMVTGVDYSRRSIAYAVQSAQEQQLAIEYRCQNYLELAEFDRYDAALLIYGDYCPLSSEERRRLLVRVHRALKPGGFFALDVTTRAHRRRHGSGSGWYAVETGFWKPGPHLVLEEGFDYPEDLIFLDQAIVIEGDGRVSVYRMWFQDFTPGSITAELENGGFAVRSLWGDLGGSPLEAEGEWIGVLAQKTDP